MSGAAIKVLYFAQVAELTKRREESWPLAMPVTGTEWLVQLERRYPDLGPVGRLRIAINKAHAPHSSLIEPGDEVAVFEPVTGG